MHKSNFYCFFNNSDMNYQFKIDKLRTLRDNGKRITKKNQRNILLDKIK